MPSIINASTSGAGGVITTADASGQLELQTAGVTRQTIDVNGNVGIGTSSPSTLGLTVYKASGSSGSRYSSGTNNFEISINGVDAYVANGANGPLQFWTNGSERMRIDSSGNVLVNNTSTIYGKISVQAGSFNALDSTWATNGAGLSTFGGYGGGLVMIDGSAGYALYCADSGKDFYIRGNNVGTALTGGVYLNDRGTSWTSASDERVKDIIEPIKNAVQKVSLLRAVIGKYKDEDKGKRHPFLIAQDVQAVLPEAGSVMNKGEQNECLGLSYTDTIPLLVAAIQEQQAIITDLKARIEVLEGASA